MMDEGFSISPEMLVKAVGYAAPIAAVGACAVRWPIVPRLGAIADASGLLRSAARVLLTASALGAVSLAFRAWAHTLSAFGVQDSLVWENIRLIALESRWGQGWVWQAGAGLAALVVGALVRAGAVWAWPVATIAVVSYAAATPLVGHAAGDPLRMSIHAAHLLGGGLWIGSLFVLFLDLVARRQNTVPLQLFAPVALTGSATIALSGLIAAALYIGSPGALFATGYGRALLLKVALFLAAAAYGYVNWRRMQQASSGTVVVSRQEMIGTAGRELTFACALLLVTGVLTELPNP
jgi:copper transport protein